MTLEDANTLNVKMLERLAIERAMLQFSGDKKRAARILGLSLKTLYSKIDRYKWRDRDWTKKEEAT